MADRAAALTYYMMMSLFPALLVGVSLLGLLGDRSLVTDAVDYASDNGAPAEVTDALEALLTKTVTAAGGAVSSALVLGVAIALYGASGAFGAAGRALNHVYGVEESRGFVKHKLADIAFTIARHRAGDRRARVGLPRRRPGRRPVRHDRPRRHRGGGVARGALGGRGRRRARRSTRSSSRSRPTSARGGGGSSAPAGSSASGSGSSRRSASSSTSRTSAGSAPRTAPSPAR